MVTQDFIKNNYEWKLDKLAGLSWANGSDSSIENLPDLSGTRECFDAQRYLYDNPTVREIIDKGLAVDAWDHWIRYGRTQRRFARFIPYFEVLNDKHFGSEIYILADQSKILNLENNDLKKLKNKTTILYDSIFTFDSPSYILCSNRQDLLIASKFVKNESSFIFLKGQNSPFENMNILSVSHINLNNENAFVRRGLPRYLSNLNSPIYGSDKLIASMHIGLLFGAKRIVVVGEPANVASKTDEKKFIPDLVKALKAFSVELFSTEEHGLLSKSGAKVDSLEKLLRDNPLKIINKKSVSSSHIINEGYREPRKTLFMDRAEGQKIYDSNGRAYIDTAMAAGTAILGHANPIINNSISSALNSGLVFSRPTLSGIQLGDRLHAIFPWFSQFALATTGSEATMRMIRIVRSFTGKEKIGIFSGAWHGSHDFLLIDDDAVGPEGKPNPGFRSSGIPESLLDLVVLLPSNSESAFDIIYDKKDELAAVLCEPIQGSNPKEGDVDFIRKLREVTTSCGILMAFDEIITGGRLDLGGFQKKYNIFGDIAAYGKIFGGGLPIGIVGGTKEVMSSIQDPEVRGSSTVNTGNVVLGGTFSGNPIVLSSAIKIIDLLEANKDTIYPYIDDLGEQIRQEINNYCEVNDIAARMYGVGSICRLIITDYPIRSARHRDELEAAKTIQTDFYNRILDLGIHVGSNRLIFLSVAHEQNDIINIVQVFQRALSEFAGKF